MDDEPKPKRSAWRHAAGGLALLVCLGLSMWLIERRGWTNFSGWWQRGEMITQRGQVAIRDEVEFEMTRVEVHRRIGTGRDEEWSPKIRAEAYLECGFRIIYQHRDTGEGDGWLVLRVEDINADGSLR